MYKFSICRWSVYSSGSSGYTTTFNFSNPRKTIISIGCPLRFSDS